MATQTISYGTHSALTVTNLNSLANSATAGWQSDLIDNRTEKAIDYEILVELDMASTGAANDKAVYVYISPAYHDGSAWHYTDGGTAAPSGSEGTYTIAAPHNFRRLGVLAYTTTGQVVKKVMHLSSAVGQTMPDGFSIIIINYTGAAVAASANVVAVKPIKYDIA